MFFQPIVFAGWLYQLWQYKDFSSSFYQKFFPQVGSFNYDNTKMIYRTYYLPLMPNSTESILDYRVSPSKVSKHINHEKYEKYLNIWTRKIMSILHQSNEKYDSILTYKPWNHENIKAYLLELITFVTIIAN